MELLLPALQDVLTPISLMALIGGVLYGVVVGAMPGLGSVIAVTLIFAHYLFDGIGAIRGFGVVGICRVNIWRLHHGRADKHAGHAQ